MNFLSNEPIGEDLLSSHTQDRIAEVIVNNINDLKMIGIDGPWGAGKSNLVKIIQKKLEDDDINYHFFIYDAWAHQTDYQKRALIEELVLFLKNEPFIFKDTTELEEGKNKVLGTVINTSTNIKLKFSWATAAVLIALIINPFTTSLSMNIDNWNVKTIVSLIPLIIICIMIIACYRKSNGWSDFKDNLIEAYNKGAKNTSKREYKNTEDPSTVSMKQFVNVVNNELDENEKLVIVVDNLDRLPQKNVQDVWTTIQSCFNDNTLKFKKIKVMVPFDREHLKMCQDGDGDKSYLDDYIDKTFDMVFRVPYPVLDDWNEYFTKQWIKVFGECEEEESRQELDMVRIIFDEFTEDISPRRINAFINAVRNLSLLDDRREIKNRYKAVFVCKKKEILADPLRAITKLDYLQPLDRLFEYDNDFYKSMAALIYLIPLERGVEVAIFRTLRNALSSGDLNEVRKIATIPTFSSILEKILVRVNGVDVLERYVCTLGKLETDAFRGVEAYQNIWETIFELLGERKFQLIMDGETYIGESKIALISHVKNDEKVLIKDKILTNMYSLDNVNPIKFAKTIDVLDECLNVYGIDVFKSLKKKDVAWGGEFVEFIKEKGDAYVDYKLCCDEATVDRTYEGMPVGELMSINILPQLIKGGYELNGLKKHAIDEINKLLPYEQFEMWWSIFSRFSNRKGHLHEEMKKISIPIGTLEIYLQSAKQKKNNLIIEGVLCIAICKYKDSDFSAHQTIKACLSSNNYASEVTRRLSKYIGLDDLLLKFNELKNSNLYYDVCNEVFCTEYDWWANVGDILPQLEDIINQLGLNREKVFEFLSDWELDEYITNDNINKKMPIDFLSYIQDKEDRLSLSCKDIFRKYVDNISEDEWGEILNTNSVPYEIRGGILVGFKWNIKAWNALRKHIVDMCNIQKIFGDVTFLKELIDDVRKYQNIGGLLGDIWDIISKRNITVEEFKAWGGLLFENNKVICDGATLRRFINTEVLKDDECLQILVDNLETVKIIRDSAEDNERPDFDSNVIEMAKKSDNAKVLAVGLKLEFEENDELNDA